MTRLVVYEALEGPAVSRGASAEFGRDLVRRLATCGVAASVLVADPMNPMPFKQRLDAALEQQASHAVLVVQAMGGNLGANSEVRVALKVADVRVAEPLWEADGTTFFARNRLQDGAAFSILVVTKLRDDGVLSGCRAEAYPGCLEDRRRELMVSTTPQTPSTYPRKPARRCEVAAPGSVP